MSQRNITMRALIAGVLYFAIVFGVGFLLGTIRVMLVVPRLGEAGAVLIELPLMLTASWITCGWVLRRLCVGPGLGERLTMGGVAFALLMLAELGVSVLALGRTPAEHLATYRSASAVLGLVAQLIFAAMPLLRRTKSYADAPSASGEGYSTRAQPFASSRSCGLKRAL